MANLVPVTTTLNAADLITTFGSGAKVYLYSSATEAGSYSVVTSTALVAGTEYYELLDSNGTSSTWYKAAFGTSAGSGTSGISDYSPAWQAGSTQSYASLDDLREVVSIPDEAENNHLLDILEQASRWVDAKTERLKDGFYRHPQVSGTETRTFNVDRSTNYLTVDLAAAPTTVEIATATAGTYTTLAATDYLLDYGDDGRIVGIFLSDVGSYTHWYPGFATIRIVGAFGFATVPALIKRATLDVAREFYRQGPNAGLSEFDDVNTGRLPLSVWDAVNAYKRRTFEYV